MYPLKSHLNEEIQVCYRPNLVRQDVKYAMLTYETRIITILLIFYKHKPCGYSILMHAICCHLTVLM